MAVFLDRVGAESAPSRRSWSPRDCSLYALAVGAGWDEVDLVTEEASTGRAQRVVPTFVLAGVVAAESAAWPDPCWNTGDFPLERVVLGQQSLVLHRPVGPRGEVDVVTRVAAIVDKGSGALIVIDVDAVDAGSGDPWFTASCGLFVVGETGFEGRGEAPAAVPGPPDRAPDHRVDRATLPIQTLLYRHAGNDPNPVHTDPEFAARAGFKGPILSGQNTLGFAARALVGSVAGGDPTRLVAVEGRFRAPAYNGDVLGTESWMGDDVGVDDIGRAVVLFRVVDQDGAVVVDRGRAVVAPAT